MVQVPTATKLTVLPVTVQTLVKFDVNVTAKPEVALAVTMKDPLPSNLVASVLKVIVCAALAIANDCVTWTAAL